MSIHDYVVTLIPLVPMLEPILEAIPLVLNTSTSWSL